MKASQRAAADPQKGQRSGLRTAQAGPASLPLISLSIVVSGGGGGGEPIIGAVKPPQSLASASNEVPANKALKFIHCSPSSSLHTEKTQNLDKDFV